MSFRPWISDPSRTSGWSEPIYASRLLEKAHEVIPIFLFLFFGRRSHTYRWCCILQFLRSLWFHYAYSAPLYLMIHVWETSSLVFSDSIVPEKLFLVADQLIPNIHHEYVDTSHKSVQWTSSLKYWTVHNCAHHHHHCNQPNHLNDLDLDYHHCDHHHNHQWH